MAGLGPSGPGPSYLLPLFQMLFSGRKGIVKGRSVLLLTLKPKNASMPKQVDASYEGRGRGDFQVLNGEAAR